MEVESCCCFCCGDDLSGGEKKKRRRRLANPDFKESLSVLVYLASELRACIDVSRMHDRYICRSCATMLDKCSNLHQKISNKLRAALHRLPSSKVAADQSPIARPARRSLRSQGGLGSAPMVASGSTESPTIVVR